MANVQEQFVAERAGHRCEYCHVPAVFLRIGFVCDHIIVRKHGGTSDPDNLAWACPHCNSFKLDNIAGLDLPSPDVVRLFNPRRDAWSAHFRWEGGTLVGATSIGRATIRVLNMNEPQRCLHRVILMNEGIAFD